MGQKPHPIKVNVIGDTAFGLLVSGHKLICDAEDAYLLRDYCWKYRKGNRGMFYVKCTSNRCLNAPLHRMVLGFPKGVIDHKNHNTLDNRKSNLRVCTHQQNMWNCKAKKKRAGIHSKFKGVHFDQERREWKTAIGWKHKQWHIGRFQTQEDAAIAYNVAAQLLFGEFAYLNNI